MKGIRYIVLSVAALIAAFLSGCGTKRQEMVLVNEQHFRTEEVSELRLDYDNDDITLLESDSNDIVLREYMDIDKSSYYARIRHLGSTLHIEEGRRPGGNRLGCYVELYLPAGFTADIGIHTTESSLKTLAGHTMGILRAETTRGSLEIAGINAREVYVSSANGTVSMRNVTADTISIDAANARVEADHITGEIRYNTSGGTLILSGANGCGIFEAASDGHLELSFAEITGDISAVAGNGSIYFKAPAEAAFRFFASSRNGSIDSSYDSVAVNGGQASGDVGTNPVFCVELKTHNGKIEVR